MRFFEPWGQQQGGERETGDVRVSETTRRHQLESSLPSCTNLSFCLPNNPGPSSTAEFLCPHMHTVSDSWGCSGGICKREWPSWPIKCFCDDVAKVRICYLLC
jgi:hypothetical protein